MSSKLTDQRPPDPLEYELQEGRAIALGKAGQKLEAALALLTASEGEREQLLADAADAVWSYMIVRETLGFHDHALALGVYRVPPQVMARVGVVRRR